MSNLSGRPSADPRLNEDYYKLKNWFNLFLEHKSLPAKNIAIVHPNKPPTYYRIFINSINKIPQNKVIGTATKPHLKISVTFFNKNKRKFYGRTYNSMPIPLVLNQQNSQGFETSEPINLFFYSTIDRTPENVLIFEALLIELEGSLSKRETPLGWAEIEVYIIPPQPPPQGVQQNLPPQFKASPFFEGSSRSLLNLAPDKVLKKPIGPTLLWKAIDCPELKSIAHLFDETILCGNDDILPGIEGRRLLNPLSEKNELPQPMQSFKVMIDEIYLKLPISIENQLVRYGQNYRMSTYNLGAHETKALTDVTVRDRKFIAIFHNTWTAVNSKRYENGTSLLPNREIPGEYHFDGSFPLDSVFLDQMSIICFQIECLLSLPLPGNRIEEIKVIMGWCPIFLTQEKIQNALIPIKENLIGGPGKNLTGEKMFEWELSTGEVFELTCLINMTKVPKMSSNNEGNALIDAGMDEKAKMLALIYDQKRKMEEMQEAHKFALSQAQTQAQTQVQINSQANFQAPPKIQVYDPSILNLEKQLAEMKQLAQQIPMATTNNQPNEEVIKLVDMYKQEAEKTRLEMEAIKNALLEIQVKNKEKEDKEAEERAKIAKETQNMALTYNHFLVDKVKDADFTNTQTRFQNTQPQFNDKTLSRGDMALLLQAGIKGLLDRVDVPNVATDMTLEKCLKTELTDHLKASTIFIQFLAIKPAAIAQFNKGESLSPETYQFPQKIYFTFNFFNFNTKKTETICLQSSVPQDNNIINSHGIPFYLIRETYLQNGIDSKEPLYKFEIDPSLEHQTHQHIELVKYFWKKALSIDIWDAESLMLFGSVKIPLREAIRNGRAQAGMTKEFEIIEPAFMRIKGGLQISIKNVGHEPIKNLKTDGPDALRNTMLSKTSKLMAQSSKKKVSSKKPLNLTEQMKQFPVSSFDSEAMTNPDIRKQERINRYKYAAVEGGLISDDPNQINEEINKGTIEGFKPNNDVMHLKNMKHLREITNFRETKKQFFLKSVMNQQYDDEKYINVSFGKAEVFSLEIVNYSEVDEPYSILIDDPDSKYLRDPECQTIYIPEEWKFWVEKKGFSRPAEWNMIARDPANKNSYTIFLRKGEKCEVLFKFMTFRGIEDIPNGDNGNGGIQANPENEEKKRLYISSRSLNITVSHMKGRLLTGLKINVEPHPSIVDHIFRFFEQENRHVTLNLPALYYHSAPPLNRPRLALTYDEATWNWLNDKEVALELKVPPARSVLRFNLLAYEDIHFAELIGNWIIEVHSCTGVDIEVKVGQITSTKLILPPEIARLVKMYISHPSIGYFPSPYDKPFTLVPGSIGDIPSGPANAITLNIRTFNVKTQNILVNCVDVNTREKVHSWIVKVIGTQPQVTKIIEVNCKLGIEAAQRFIYENRSAKWGLFDFVSSNPELLEIVDKNIPINPGDRGNVRIKFARRENPSTAEVCVFASDTEEKLFDCILFKIRYTV